MTILFIAALLIGFVLGNEWAKRFMPDITVLVVIALAVLIVLKVWIK